MTRTGDVTSVRFFVAFLEAGERDRDVTPMTSAVVSNTVYGSVYARFFGCRVFCGHGAARPRVNGKIRPEAMYAKGGTASATAEELERGHTKG